ncbi:MAG TPA: substrate-binding domain-containing protein [Baekduia sp.]|nr:substrate-binding domain-containing protein [Baekduia sp.]
MLRCTPRAVRPGIALAAFVVSLALAGGVAPRAGAALLPHCTGANVSGVASSLQGLAQGVWTGDTGGGFNASAVGCASAPTVSVGSNGHCLLDWHADGTAFDTSFALCGSDAPPTTTQISTVNAPVATGGAQTSVLSIPVAQSAIAIAVNPPSGCTITTATAATVERVFRGTVTTWAGLGATGCGSATITPVVRGDWDGETYQFKHWLTTQFNGTVTTSPNRTWADLQVSSTNSVWPGSPIVSKSGCTMSGTCHASGGFGDEDEVQTVGAHEGSIGYAALWAVRKKYIIHTYPNLKWITIHQGFTVTDPSTNGLATTYARSNCPSATSAYGFPPPVTITWSGVYETTPGSAYPICTLTYALAFTDYRTRWGATTGQTTATTVHDYLNYVVSTTGGQTDALASNNDYAPLPSDLRHAATTGVAQISD